MAMIEDNNIHGGKQLVFRFINGYGASVVRHSFSYGNEDGKWELAVLMYSDETTSTLTYLTPITRDVEGYLSDDDVSRMLNDIEAMPNIRLCQRMSRRHEDWVETLIRTSFKAGS